MKRILALGLVCIFLLSGCSHKETSPKETGVETSQTSESTSEISSQEVPQKMVLMKEIRYNADDEILSSSEYTYDESGNLIECATHDADGNLKSLETLIDEEHPVSLVSYGSNGNPEKRTDYVYDEDGRRTSTTYSQEDEPSYTDKNVYNEKGQKTEVIRTQNGISFTYQKNSYDERGQELTTYSYFDDGSIMCIATNEYDQNGNLTTVKYDYQPPYAFSTYLKYKYDDNGNCIECICCDEAGTEQMKEIVQYDDYGNRIRYDSYDGETLLSYTVFEYGTI